MKQPNLQEIGCPIGLRCHIFCDFQACDQRYSNSIQFSNLIFDRMQRNWCPDSVHAIIISREVVFNEISQWQQVKSAQFVAVGPSMCWRSHGLHWLLLGLHPLVPQTTHQSKWSDENKLVRLKIRMILGYWWILNVLLHVSAQQLLISSFQRHTRKVFSTKRSNSFKASGGPWLRDQAAIQVNTENLWCIV